MSEKNVFLVELIIQKDIGLNISKKGIMTSFYLFNSAIFFETFDFFVKKLVRNFGACKRVKVRRLLHQSVHRQTLVLSAVEDADNAAKMLLAAILHRQ